MEKFSKVTEPVELDFFSIFKDEDGRKMIHIFGYTYESSSMEYVTEQNPNGTYWANMECSWFIVPLAQFIKCYKENNNYVDETYAELNQYQRDCTKEEMENIINHYFDGEPAKSVCFSFGELTEETPCGNYVVISK